jgi:riboflavin synthase
MFTGIIETTGIIKNLEKESTNLNIYIQSDITHELKIDQSVAHNGVCLTVVAIEDKTYKVTAIDETLQKTNIGKLIPGSVVNLERCMPANGRFDGHIVQGHVDQVAKCKKIEDLNGSWKYTFDYISALGNTTVEKGSVCINGVSLTVVDSKSGEFSVAIIPYTYEHTNFKTLTVGDAVNLEFDIIGKYVAKMLESRMIG